MTSAPGWLRCELSFKQHLKTVCDDIFVEAFELRFELSVNFTTMLHKLSYFCCREHLKHSDWMLQSHDYFEQLQGITQSLSCLVTYQSKQSDQGPTYGLVNLFTLHPKCFEPAQPSGSMTTQPTKNVLIMGLFFVYFLSFLITISIMQIEKSLDGVLGIRTWGRRMVGADNHEKCFLT